MISLADPLKSDGHVLRTQAREAGLGVNAPFLLIYLSQGQSFDIAVLNITQGTLTTTFTEYEYSLTPSEADSITDYTDLEIRMEASCNTGTCGAGNNRDRVHVSWVEFAVLDQPIIPPPTLDTVSVVNSTSLQVNFTEPVDTSQILSYNIELDNGFGFTVAGNVPQGTTTFVAGDLTSDSFYTVRIISVGASENSIASNSVSQRTTVILFSAHPDANLGVRWVNGLGVLPCEDTVTFECVNEVIRDDNDFIQSTGIGDTNTDLDSFSLSDIEDPLRSDGHFLKYTLREAGVGTNQLQFTIELRQNVTIIATYIHAQGSISENYELFTQELTNLQADGITDYSDLIVEITASCPVSCTNIPSAREKLNVSWITFEIEHVSAPPIESLELLTLSTIRVSWESQNVDAQISDIMS